MKRAKRRRIKWPLMFKESGKSFVHGPLDQRFSHFAWKVFFLNKNSNKILFYDLLIEKFLIPWHFRLKSAIEFKQESGKLGYGVIHEECQLCEASFVRKIGRIEWGKWNSSIKLSILWNIAKIKLKKSISIKELFFVSEALEQKELLT